MPSVWEQGLSLEIDSIMEFEINTKGKELFLALSTLTLIVMMVITTVLWWFASPRLHEINSILADVSLALLRIFYLVLILGTILVFLTCFLEKNFLIAKFAVHAYIRILFPVTVFLGTLIGINKDKIRESFVYVNNSFIKAIKKKFRKKDIIILIPHCLQNIECSIRITVDISKCAECGRCNVGDLCQLARKYDLKVAVATGGTLARKIIIENNPKFIIAVACQRDLVDGLQEVFPIPVYGVLNERPCGPCVNTRVDVDLIEKAIKSILI